MQAQYGLGRHTVYIGQDNATQLMKWNQLARLSFIPCMALAKVSICFFLLRILDSRTHAHFRTYIWLVMGASVVSNIVLLVVWALQCIPFEATWDPNIDGQCLSQSVVVDVAYVQAGQCYRVFGETWQLIGSRLQPRDRHSLCSFPCLFLQHCLYEVENKKRLDYAGCTRHAVSRNTLTHKVYFFSNFAKDFRDCCTPNSLSARSWASERLKL